MGVLHVAQLFLIVIVHSIVRPVELSQPNAGVIEYATINWSSVLKHYIVDKR